MRDPAVEYNMVRAREVPYACIQGIEGYRPPHPPPIDAAVKSARTRGDGAEPGEDGREAAGDDDISLSVF